MTKSSPVKSLIWPAKSSLLPALPGVYWWLGKNREILYVGKAKNLKNRLSAYKHTGNLTPKIRQMLAQAQMVCWQILRNELEALLVEAELINSYQPPFNTLLKDDKSPLYIVITNEEWPRVLRVRKRDWLKNKIKGRVFGPFPSSYKVSEVLKLAREIFPWCNAPRRKVMRRCFYNHLGLCAGVCAGEISREEYQKIINQLVIFLTGKTNVLTRTLQRELKMAQKKLEFERAAIIRDKLKLIAEVTSETAKLRQDYLLPNLVSERSEQGLIQLKQILSTYLPLPRQIQLGRIEGYDVSNTSGKQAVVAMVVFVDGVAEKSDYRSFNIKTLTTPNDVAMMAEAVERRSRHDEWETPQLILIDGGKGQVRAVLQVLAKTKWSYLPIIGLAKNPDRIIIPIKKEGGQRLKIEWQVMTLSSDNLALQLLQQVRDEAHRFSKSKHTQRRQKRMLDQ